MKILAIAPSIPMPDKASGDLRFFSILKALAKTNDVTLTTYGRGHNELDSESYDKYLKDLVNINISHTVRYIDAIKKDNFDAVYFELYFSAEYLLDLVRFYQPTAHILIDSVDVHFNRLESKAELTRLPEDYIVAKKTKHDELKIYNKADTVIAVTEKDQQLLKECNLKANIVIIPNIHLVPDFQPKSLKNKINLLFVGTFTHSPNVDAVSFFCNDVMPQLRKKFNNIQFNIVGSLPTPKVLSLASEDINVIGYVPSVAPYYSEADIVIAPLRYGGGMKGKVGEAFSYSTPVVTTDYGAEGFNIIPDQHFMLANTPEEFVTAISRLITDHNLYASIAKNAWEFVNNQYSEAIAEKNIKLIFENLSQFKLKKLSLDKKIKFLLIQFTEQNVLWRLNRFINKS